MKIRRACIDRPSRQRPHRAFFRDQRSRFLYSTLCLLGPSSRRASSPLALSAYSYFRTQPIMADSALPDEVTELPIEDALQRLEAIVERLENDPPDLESALDAYEEGVALARHCLDRLDAAELRVEELSLEP